MANLTLTIDEQVVRRARIRAIENGTSINAVVRDFLGKYASGATAADGLQRFVLAARQSTAGSGPGGRTWTREDLQRYPERG